MTKLKTRFSRLYQRANQQTGGVLAVVRQTLRSFGQARASGAAASVAYYALFSLFPLLLALVALAMVGVLVVLLTLSVVSTTVINLLPQLNVPLWHSTSVYETVLWSIGAGFLPWLLSFGLFLALYRWVPNTTVPWRAALWGGGVAALLWEIAKRGFLWYLNAGLARYSLVYGSLGTVVALMFWLYLSASITFLGAHLAATVASRR